MVILTWRFNVLKRCGIWRLLILIMIEPSVVIGCFFRQENIMINMFSYILSREKMYIILLTFVVKNIRKTFRFNVILMLL